MSTPRIVSPPDASAKVPRIAAAQGHGSSTPRVSAKQATPRISGGQPTPRVSSGQAAPRFSTRLSPANALSAPQPIAGKKRKYPWLAIFSSNSFLLSVLVHLFFGVGAAYLIVEHFANKHIDFKAEAPPSPHNEVEHQIQMAKKNNVESAPPDLKRITTTDVAAITLPDVPNVPMPDDASPTSMGAGDGALGAGMGGGDGSGGNGSGLQIPPFGTTSGTGLEGTLYDLKQTPDRQPTKIAAIGPELTTDAAVGNDLPPAEEGRRVLRDFVRDWDLDKLNKFYKAPIKLEAQQIFIPRLAAAQAPAAFKVSDTVHPRRWVIYYHGKIVPPKTGDFRFIGFGDDFLMVRIDGRNVLDGSEPDARLDLGANNDNEDVGLAPRYTGHPMNCGKWIQMQEGTPMNLEVLIGEGPGGDSSYFLLIQEKGVDYPKGDYPAFQVADVPLPAGPDADSVPPAFTGKKMVFSLDDSP